MMLRRYEKIISSNVFRDFFFTQVKKNFYASVFRTKIKKNHLSRSLLLKSFLSWLMPL